MQITTLELNTSSATKSIPILLIHIRMNGTFYKLETVMLTLICLISTLEFKCIKIMISQNKKTEYNDFNFYNIVWLLRDISSNKDNDTHV